MTALFCLFLSLRSYSEKLEEHIPTFYKIRYILQELYMAVIPIISRLKIYIDQLNEGRVKNRKRKTQIFFYSGQPVWADILGQPKVITDGSIYVLCKPV